MNPVEVLAALKGADKVMPYDPCWDVAQPVPGPAEFGVPAVFDAAELYAMPADAATVGVTGRSLKPGMVIALSDGNYRWLGEKRPSITNGPSCLFVAYDRGSSGPVLFDTPTDRVWLVVST